MVAPKVVEEHIRQGIDGVEKVVIRDLTGTQDHYEALIVATGFEGKSRIQMHQMVYGALGDLMKGPVHALTMKTYTPEIYAKLNG